MRQGLVSMIVVSAVFFGHSEIEARSGGGLFSKVKSRIAQRLAAAGKPFFRQAGAAVLLCTALGCAGVKQQAELVEPKVAMARAEKVETELFGEGKSQTVGIHFESIEKYLAAKDNLGAQFYDGSLVYFKDGASKNHVRRVKALTDGTLEVFYFNKPEGEQLVVSQIEGILVGRHPDYGTSYYEFSPADADLFNVKDQSILKLLTSMPEWARLSGAPSLIFSDGTYTIKTSSFRDPHGDLRELPHEFKVLINVSDLVPIPVPEDLKPPIDDHRPPRTGEEAGIIAAAKVTGLGE